MEDKPECRFCANLGEVLKPLPREIDARGLPYLRCTFGRYDIKTPTGTAIPRYFAWSGIWRPNKTVAAAQKDCPDFKVHPQVIASSKRLEWHAGNTASGDKEPGRWTVRRDHNSWVVVFHFFDGRPENIIATFPPTEEGGKVAKAMALKLVEVAHGETKVLEERGH